MNRLLALLSIALVSICFSSTSFAHDNLTVEFEYDNLTNAIDDGIIDTKVSGGTAPYSYKWSERKADLNTSKLKGAGEGIKYSLTVTDADGNSSTAEAKVPATSFEEGINAGFKPAVNWFEAFLFWDPLAAIGVYDPVLKDDAGEIMYHPNGDPITQGLPLVVIWLVFGAIFFTIKMKFINIKGFKHAFALVRGNFDNPNDKGEVSHFQALTTALSGTVGLGNIAGVAVAVSVGGAGATFWMIAAGLLGMSSKFVECTLGVKYRKVDENGHVSGGPMYYLSRGLEKRNMGRLGKVLAAIFAVLCIGGSFGGGNMFQANQAFASLSNSVPQLEGSGFMFGVILAVLVGTVIIGGIKSIAKVTDKIVPFMVGVYVLFALIIIFMNIGEIGTAFSAIFNGAFSPDSLKGGVIGVLIVGFQRAAFSNEAGVGSASIAHSASKTSEPVSEGIVALLEPFIDTVVVCTMTALVLIFTGYASAPGDLTGAELTSKAFTEVFPWFEIVLVVAILLFAFSTMISWSYYGLKSWQYLFGEGKTARISYQLLFLLFVVVGSSVGLGSVLGFSDAMILGMAFPNILGLLLLSSEVKADMIDYFKRIKDGTIKKYK